MLYPVTVLRRELGRDSCATPGIVDTYVDTGNCGGIV